MWKKLLGNFLLVAAPLVALLQKIYAGSPVADIGISLVPSDYVVYGVPAVAAAGVTAIRQFGLPKLPKLPSLTSSKPTTLIDLVNKLEVELAKQGGPVETLAQARKYALQALK